MKLFAIYIGGEVEGANIEVHDMRFSIAPSIAETYEDLRHQWWGIPKSLHIDCWAEISEVDGYRIELLPDPFTGPKKLYYINLGGYVASEFLEKHRNEFMVATTVAEAKKRAIREVTGWAMPHRDDIYEAEQAISLSMVGREQNLHVHLTPTMKAAPLAFECRYTPIGKLP